MKIPGGPTRKEVAAYSSGKVGALSWGRRRHPEEAQAHTELGDSWREQLNWLAASGQLPGPRPCLSLQPRGEDGSFWKGGFRGGGRTERRWTTRRQVHRLLSPRKGQAGKPCPLCMGRRERLALDQGRSHGQQSLGRSGSGPPPAWSPRGGTRLLSSCTWAPPHPGGPRTAEASLGSIPPEARTQVSSRALRPPARDTQVVWGRPCRPRDPHTLAGPALRGSPSLTQSGHGEQELGGNSQGLWAPGSGGCRCRGWDASQLWPHRQQRTAGPSALCPRDPSRRSCPRQTPSLWTAPPRAGPSFPGPTATALLAGGLWAPPSLAPGRPSYTDLHTGIVTCCHQCPWARTLPSSSSRPTRPVMAMAPAPHTEHRGAPGVC